MANLTESPIYTPGIFQLEKTTPPLGGTPVIDNGVPSAGHANAQALQLANRTNNLNLRLTSAEDDIDNLQGQFSYGPVNVKTLGAVGSPTDDSSIFQAAVDSLPALGGTIEVPPGSYTINTKPVEGNKSILWLISPGARFIGTGTGEGKFPYMLSNPAQMAVGPYIRSHSPLASTNSNGGIAALNAEMIQPSSYSGQSVAAYFGAIGSSTQTSANVWALNTLVRAEAGAAGTYQCIEVDVDNFASGALVKGISISGAGTVSPKVALEIVRANNTPWLYGIDALNCVTGVRVRASTQTTCGVIVGSPAVNTGVVFTGQQLANAGEGLMLQRFTDTSATGNFIRCVNAANTASLFTVGINGDLIAASIVSGAIVRVGSPTQTTSAAISAKQLANNQDNIVLQRFTDTSPTGSFLRGVNAANSTVLFTLGVDGGFTTVASVSANTGISTSTGNITASVGYVRGSVLEATGPVTTSATGAVRFSATTATTVGGAGGGAALPATPVKYLVVNQDGVNYKIPLYTS